MKKSNQNLYSVIGASSLGTLIEWYDFYIFGSLATIISEKFFPSGNPTAAFLSTLATFAAGFIVRPFGALVFGRLGDLVGRKYTFLVTLVIMGGSTFCIGLIPGYATFKAAPVVILLLRLLQGLALGGEYGGAATYVAEHAPENRRGYFTSWIQTTATLGLFVSLLVILGCQTLLSKDDFYNWGWRIPFLLSIALVGVSIIIRLKMQESPLFEKLKAEGKVSANPLKESFGHKANLKMVLLALFGATMGQGVVWYTGQFYAQTFLLKTCNLDATQVNTWMGIALLLATPFFVVFGALSDKIGRKTIMLAGMLIALICYRPIFASLYSYADASHKTEIAGKRLSQTTAHIDASTGDSAVIVSTMHTYTDGSVLTETQKKTFAAGTSRDKAIPQVKKSMLLGHMYGSRVVGFIFVLVLFVTMVYGPIAAFLVELFPTHIRYTSMSLPYHIGNGVFGGLVPFIGTLMYEYSKTPANPSGDVLAGLWYPIGIAAACFIIGALYVSTKHQKH
ncbi:MFS transporter, MHS family, proline/betaine transporter [Filimonas lacunae]|uniref:MFS transporter, MHS family, proline/betaine transporter n=1 Tax=Filimonas lacunae TaxID=477680 RepID=A0A173MPL1_9BACT|nr:MFS transporter [Filimonas lacunae]BAV09298.1 sugar transport protein [Filimonas lacunae]SIS70705.1 MFS transporter, MHS family, proline/betaine transporter [Filimonas lacunae]